MTHPAAPSPPLRPSAMVVVDPGARTTIQDLGRAGRAHLGIPPSGAADAAAFMLANRLVGNAEGAPALETTLRGPSLRFLAPATVALSGADVEATIGSSMIAMHAPFRVRAGQELRVGSATRGLRTYIAVRGGIGAPEIFGSTSNDELTGLGSPPLAVGDELALAGFALEAPTVDVAPVPSLQPRPVLHVVLGPREDWFAPDAITALLREPFGVTASVNRIGARLSGPTLMYRGDEQLRSEGVVAGSIQVPPSGNPIVLLADHPTTGGYPVIAVVIEADLGRAAQLRPGDEVRFALRPAAPR